jgi:ketosteroid isomerase-like protein
VSRENVDLVRSLIEAYQRADFRALAEGCDEDFEFTSVMTTVEETFYRGRDAWEAYWADMHETWEEWQVEVLQVFEGRDDTVAVITRLVGKGKSSGALVDRTIGISYRVRNGKLWRMHSYLDPEDALEAVGLRD